MGDKLARYIQRGQRSVGGWLEPGAARMIVSIDRAQRRLAIGGNVAEIGVHHGKLFIVLYLLTRAPEMAVALDLFSRQELNADHSGHGDLAIFLDNMRRHADINRLKIHEGDSTEIGGDLLVRLGGGSFRLISVDGGHTAEITAHDLSTAEAALCEGGVIVLDDCFNEMWPGVAEGTFRYFIGPRRLVPFATGANKTLFCRPQFAGQYIDAVRGTAEKYAERVFMGQTILCLDFAALSWAESMGKIRAWQLAKDFPPLSIARRIYRRRHAIFGL